MRRPVTGAGLRVAGIVTVKAWRIGRRGVRQVGRRGVGQVGRRRVGQVGRRGGGGQDQDGQGRKVLDESVHDADPVGMRCEGCSGGLARRELPQSVLPVSGAVAQPLCHSLYNTAPLSRQDFTAVPKAGPPSTVMGLQDVAVPSGRMTQITST